MSEPLLQLELGFDRDTEKLLPSRLYRLGLPAITPVILTRNRTILVSWDVRGGLRLHAGYAWAGDQVLQAIVRFVSRGTRRQQRLQDRRIFLSFPVHQYAPTRSPRRSRRVPAEHSPLIERLERLHQILNERHFDGALAAIPIRLSGRMMRRLGEFEATEDGKPWAITVSHRHLRQDGWLAVADTLLHEMVHQWQCESGLPLDHGQNFRRKAREVGITARATRKHTS